MKKLLFTTAILLTLSTNAQAAISKIIIPPITNYVIDIPHKNAEFVGYKGRQWQRIIDSGELNVVTARKPESSDLRAIQQMASIFSYKANINIWQLPSELTKSLKGDCKDVAIWKYEKLKERGFKAENLNLWVVKLKDREVEDGQLLQHMFLTVKIDGREWLLNSPAFWGDNSYPKPLAITPEYMEEHFEFMYRFNENGATLN